MKIRLDQAEDKSASKRVYKNLMRVIILLLIIIALFLVVEIFFGTPISAHVINNDADFDQMVDVWNKPAVYMFDEMRWDNYLEIELSKDRAYRVEFYHDEIVVDYILVSTNKAKNDVGKYLYFIPDAISSKGYERIQVSVLNGSKDAWVNLMGTVDEPDFDDYAEYIIVDFEIKRLEITIEEDDFEKIKEKRDEAVELGILIADDSDYVDAIISGDGKEVKAQVRLKGDWVDHLAYKKWSYRIKLKDACMWGMQKFSIHTPETREGIGEYLIHAFYDQQGGVALRYDFLDVVINGKYVGVYAIEEGFDKRVVESSLRREGPIVKFSEDFMWESWAYYIGSDYSSSIIEYYDPSYVDFFSYSQTIENDMLFGYAKYAIDGLNRFREGEIPASEVFDLELYAKYLAVLDVFASEHGRVWHNMRYYFNPLTAKLEPITFDELALSSYRELAYVVDDPLLTALFEDQEFVDLYIENMVPILLGYDEFIEIEQKNIRKYRYILSRNRIKSIDYTTVLDEHHDYLHKVFLENDNMFASAVNEDNELVISFDKHKLLFIEIKGVMYKGRTLDVVPDAQKGSMVIDEGILGEPIKSVDINDIEVVYETRDGLEHTQSVISEKSE